jgi:hypothetical protein
VSPNEAQLRAALHHGEGEGLDAGSLISHAVGVRRERRRRMTAIAGGVTVVAVVGLGATALGTLGHGTKGGGGSSSAANGDSRMQPGGGAAGGAARSSAGGSGMHTDAAGLHCPATPDTFYLPGGGGSGQFGATDPLFARPVTRMKVCGYALTGMIRGAPASLAVGSPDAGQIADALNAAASTPPPSHKCPDNTASPSGRIEILAVDATGKKLDPVVLTVSCPATRATNGTAVRYPAEVPQRFIGLLDVGPIGPIGPIGTGTMHGSPVR